MPFRRKPKRLFYSAVMLIAASGVIAAGTMYVLFMSEHWVRHSYQVQLLTARVGTELSRAGRARVSFVDTGDPKYLEEFRATRWELKRELAQLRGLVMDNPEQLARCTQVEANVEMRMRILQEAIALKDSGGSSPQAQAKLTSEIVGLASETALITDQIEETESRLLEKRRDVTSTAFGAILVLIFGILALAVSLLRQHYKLLAAELRERQAAEQNAQMLSTALMKAQDEERRRFSRELHDGLGQTLAA